MTLARRQRLFGYIAGGVMATTIALVTILGGPPSLIPHRQQTSTSATTLLWLYAPRDMGRLPDRTSWCSGAAHCWVAQEAAGATQLADQTGGWTLDASGTPRAGVATSLPVEDATGWVDFTSELSTHTDGQSASGTGSWYKLAQTQSATNLVSVSAIIMPVYRQAETRILYSHRATADSTGFSVGLHTDGKFFITVENSGGTTKTIYTTNAWDDGAWRCVRFDVDGRSANAGRIYIGATEDQQASPDLATTGSWATTGPARLGADGAGANIWPGGIARLKVRVGALSSADDCGTLWQAVKPNAWNKLASAADSVWTQTGGARCFPAGANTALCAPGGKASPTYDSSAGGWSWGITANRTNRVLWSTAICAANGWTVRSGDTVATCNGAIAPTGAKGATAITGLGAFAGRDITRSIPGYAAGATVYPSVWIRCTGANSIILRCAGGSGTTCVGQVSIPCSASAGNWRRLCVGCPDTTLTTPFVISSGGNSSYYIYASAYPTSVDLWGATLTEVDGESTIRTGATAVSTGTVAWTIDNAPAVYYSGTRGKITMAGNWISGGCLDIDDAGDDAGRLYTSGTKLYSYASDGTIDATGNLALSGYDSAVYRWDSAAIVSGTSYAQILLNGVAQTWDATPTGSWTAGTPDLINLDGYGSTSCRAAIREIKIEDRP